MSWARNNKPKYPNVQSLVNTLQVHFSRSGAVDEGTSAEQFGYFVRSFQFHISEWKQFARFDEFRYARHLIAFDERFSLLMLCFNKGQSTPVHEHVAGQSCWIKVIQGELLHTRYSSYDFSARSGDLQSQLLLKPPPGNEEVQYFDSSVGLHSLENARPNEQAICVVVYSPPYMECVYDTAAGHRATVPVIYRPLLGDTRCFRTAKRVKLQMEHQANTMFTSLDSLGDLLRHELKDEVYSQRSQETIDRVVRLLASLRFNPKEWNQYYNLTEAKYTRNLLGYDDKFTMLLLVWDKKQKSPIHNHANSSCWVKLLSGEMEEVRYGLESDQLYVKATSVLGVEDSVYIDDSLGMHRMGNNRSDSVCVSLHVYSPPYEECFCFDPVTSARSTVSLAAANAVQYPFERQSLKPSVVPNVKTLIQLLRWEISGPYVSPHVRSLLEAVKFDPQEWKEYIHFSPFQYQRILLAFNEHFSLMLNCWNKGQSTPVHDHGGDSRVAVFRVLHGTLVSTVYERTEAWRPDTRAASPVSRETTTVTAADGLHEFDETTGIHKVENPSQDETAISLHLYTPPYVDCKFTTESGETKTIPAVYCSKTTDTEQHCEQQRAAFKYQTKVFSNFQALVDVLRDEFHSQHGEAATDAVATLLDHFEFHDEEVQQYAHFEEKHNYARSLVAIDEGFSLIMTFWDPDHASAVHDHAGSRAWIKMLQGELVQNIYQKEGDRLSKVDEIPSQAQKTVCLPTDVIHNSANLSSTRQAISLHLYAPPLGECNVYEHADSGVGTRMPAERMVGACTH